MNLTFEHLALCEPKLLELEDHCRNISQRNHPWHDRNRIWYKELKPILYKLIGFGREHLHCNQHCILYSADAWDVAYRHLIDTLKV